MPWHAQLELDYHTSIGHPGVAEAERKAKELLANAASSLSPFDPPSYQLVLSSLRAQLGAASEHPLPGDVARIDVAASHAQRLEDVLLYVFVKRHP